MIVGELTELDIDPSLIEMTSWEVAKNKDFKDIVASSLNDKVNLTSIIFEDVDVPPGGKYYGRARVCIKGAGWNTINNVSIIVSETDDGVIVKNMLPTLVPAPRISITYNGRVCDLEKVPTLYATIKLEPQDLVGDNKVETYLFSYFILDSDGHVIYKLEKTRLTEVQIVDDILVANKIYTIQACCYTTLGEVSPLASVVCSTSTDGSDSSLPYFLYAFSEPVDTAQEKSVKIPYDVGVKSIVVELSLVANGEFFSIYKQEISKDDPYFKIPAGKLTKGARYKVDLTRDDVTTSDVFVVL